MLNNYIVNGRDGTLHYMQIIERIMVARLPQLACPSLQFSKQDFRGIKQRCTTSRTIQPLDGGSLIGFWRWWYWLITHCLVMFDRGGCALRCGE